MLKKLLPLVLVLCLLLAGCGASESTPAETTETAPATSANVIKPLPDTTMENLTDAILPVSFEKGDAYVDDTGKLQLVVKIYAYDKYDMVDISKLETGSILATHKGEVEITSLERAENGTVYVNGGLEAGGLDLVTDDSGVFFETGYNDAKSWYEVGSAMLRVSTELRGVDNSDPDLGEVIFYPGSLLNDEIKNYTFTPHNTTIRVAEGQVVELTRRYVP